jgi:flavin reductase (DIM6/NTAB) family NADH-FMN oxidoreductase RutF/pimeloyl-ACP methyl ester carboxylesterase
MSVTQFKGFGGVRLEADVIGSPDDPGVLLIHGAGQTRAIWADVAEALVAAGRRVITLDLRGHGASEWPADGRYDLEAFAQDLRAVLAQLESRPVVVAASFGAGAATLALETDAALLAGGLVLADLLVRVEPTALGAARERIRRDLALAAEPVWDARVIGAFDTIDVPTRMRGAAPRISVPVMFIRGTAAGLGRAADAADFVGRLPDGELVQVEDADLLVTAERLDDFEALLLDFLERKAPRKPPEYRSGADARTLRAALGCFATGVAIITATGADGQPFGLTANSFTSLSLDPPLLLVCIAKSAGSAEGLRAARHFGVNVLQIGQQPASNRFAGRGEDRFAATPWAAGETGAPLLTGSLGAFECAREAVHDGGDHFILVGRVVRAIFEPHRDPLLFFRGKYRRLHFA